MKFKQRVQAVVRALRGETEPTEVERFVQEHGWWMPGDQHHQPRDGERIPRNLRGDGGGRDWSSLFRG
jgi:hypothetical protein